MTEQRRAERWWTDVEQDRIHLEAADWLTRLQNPAVSLEDTLAWQRWMTADPRRAEAFARMEETCRVLRTVPRTALPNSYPASRRAVGQRRRWMPALAASMVAATGVITWMAMSQGLPVRANSHETLVVETSVGENRAIDLPVHVAAGEQTTIAYAAIGAAVQLPDPSVATAWQHGRLAFQSEPLRYVLEDVNRYAPKPIVTEDEAIGELRISGTVMADNVRGWIASLENAFGLQAVEERERVVLRRQTPTG